MKVRRSRGIHALVATLAISAFTGCVCGGSGVEADERGTALSQIAFPADEALVRGSPLVVRGTSTATLFPVTKVEVTADDGATWAEANGTYEWTFDFQAPDGPYVLKSRATNQKGASDESPSTVRFTLDNTPPVPRITSLQPDQLVLGTAHPLAGTASDQHGVARVEV